MVKDYAMQMTLSIADIRIEFNKDDLTPVIYFSISTIMIDDQPAAGR